eukprot:532851-Pyramimonas_sp.AAC.1
MLRMTDDDDKDIEAHRCSPFSVSIGELARLPGEVEVHRLMHSKEIGTLHSERGISLESLKSKHCAVQWGSSDSIDMPGKDENEHAAADAAFDTLDVDKMSPKDRSDHAMWQQVREKRFQFPANGAKGNPLGSRFRRACLADPDGLGKDYKEKEGDVDAAAAFRATWAQAKYTNYRAGKVKTETYKKSSWKQGQFIPLGRVAHLEGGGVL